MSKIRKSILIAGSKEILDKPDEKIALAKVLGAKVIESNNWLLINGGAKSIREVDIPTAIDYWAAFGAQEELVKNGLDPKEHIFTIHPKQTDHPLHYIGKIEVTKRKTPSLRRFDLVARSDAIITIEGLSGLTTILELAMALDKVLIPIPSTGGTSREIWDTYEPELLNKLGITRNSVNYELLTKKLDDPEITSNIVIKTLHEIFSPSFYVILSEKTQQIINDEVVMAVLKDFGIKPIIQNDIKDSHFTLTQLENIIGNSRIIIVDITGNDPIVNYQIGFAEALGKPIIILNQINISKTEKRGEFPLRSNRRILIDYDISCLDTLYRELTQSILEITSI